MTDAAREAMWKASELKYRMRRDAELRALWRDYHLDQAERLSLRPMPGNQLGEEALKALEASVMEPPPPATASLASPSATACNGGPSAKGSNGAPSAKQGEDKEAIGKGE
jgi:hypothetical protein